MIKIYSSYKSNYSIAGIIMAAQAMLIISCVSVIPVSDETLNERVNAENRIMRQNLTLAVRENSILKDENIRYMDETSRLKTRIRLLESEIESLNKKHTEDVALLNEKYDNLSRKNQILENESSTKIRELTEVNRSLEEKMTTEIARLSGEMRKQEEKYNRERAEMETAFSQKELEYQKQAAQYKKEILTAQTEMESLKSGLAESASKIAELNRKLDAANSEISQRDKTIEELRSKLESIPTAGISDGETHKKDKIPFAEKR